MIVDNIETLTWVTMAYFSGASIIAIFNYNLYFLQKKLYLKRWVQSWLTMAFAYMILFHAFFNEIDYLFGIYSLLMVSAGYLFLIAGSIFIKLTLSKSLKYIMISIYTLIILSTIFTDFVGWSIFIAYVTNAVFFFILGFNFVKQKVLFTRFIGYVILIFSLVSFTYPFIGTLPWFLPWGYMVFGMLGLLMGMLLVQIHFQSQKHDFEIMQKRMLYLINHDSLTDAYNRSLINDEFNKIDNEGIVNVGLLFIDLNNFKQVNDDFGHRKGDMVLVQVVEMLKNLIDDRGYVCRFGGDEFIVIFYNTTIQETNLYRDKIIQYGENNLIDNIEIIYAVGSAYKQTEKEDIHQLVDLAEESMYLIKHKQKDKQ